MKSIITISVGLYIILMPLIAYSNDDDDVVYVTLVDAIERNDKELATCAPPLDKSKRCKQLTSMKSYFLKDFNDYYGFTYKMFIDARKISKIESPYFDYKVCENYKKYNTTKERVNWINNVYLRSMAIETRKSKYEKMLNENKVKCYKVKTNIKELKEKFKKKWKMDYIKAYGSTPLTSPKFL